MKKDVYDWEKDPELSSKSKIVKFPLSEDQKREQRLENYIKGFEYLNGLWQKTVVIKKEKPLIYDKKDLKIDAKGRKYIIDSDGSRLYIDDFNNVYGIRVDPDGCEYEYFCDVDGEIMTFLDQEHLLCRDEERHVYEINPQTRQYIYNPNIIYSDSFKNKR